MKPIAQLEQKVPLVQVEQLAMAMLQLTQLPLITVKFYAQLMQVLRLLTGAQVRQEAIRSLHKEQELFTTVKFGAQEMQVSTLLTILQVRQFAIEHMQIPVNRV